MKTNSMRQGQRGYETYPSERVGKCPKCKDDTYNGSEDGPTECDDCKPFPCVVCGEQTCEADAREGVCQRCYEADCLVKEAVEPLKARISQLEAENARLVAVNDMLWSVNESLRIAKGVKP